MSPAVSTMGSPRSGATWARPATTAITVNGAESSIRRPQGGAIAERSRNAPRARGPSSSPATASIDTVDDDVWISAFQLWIVQEFASSIRFMTMNTLENPVTGERFDFTEVGDERLAFDLTLREGGKVPIPHVHPVQTERFTVTRGRVKFRLGVRTVLAS